MLIFLFEGVQPISYPFFKNVLVFLVPSGFMPYSAGALVKADREVNVSDRGH